MARRLGLACAIALGLGLMASNGWAGDHFDTIDNPLDHNSDLSADIVDLFAFTAPDAPDRLVLILSTHVRAGLDTRFSDVVDYGFVLRTGAKPGEGAEYRIDCTFDNEPAQSGTCRTRRRRGERWFTVPGGEVKALVGESAAQANPNMRAHFGVHADSFFGDAFGLLVMATSGVIPDWKNLKRLENVTEAIRERLPLLKDTPSDQSKVEKARNPTRDVNDLSIVLQIDIVRLLENAGYPAGDKVFRVAAETRRKGGK
jgi:hypothetical protein